MNYKRQIIIISLFFGLISLALFFILIFPFFRGLKKNSLQLVSLRQELALFQDKTEGIEELRTTYNKITQDLKKIEEVFIDPEMPVGLIEFLEKTAQDSELLIKISPASKGFRLILTGSFVDFLKFLEKTERSPYLIEINDLSVRRLAPELEFGDVQANLIIEVYGQKD